MMGSVMPSKHIANAAQTIQEEMGIVALGKSVLVKSYVALAFHTLFFG